MVFLFIFLLTFYGETLCEHSIRQGVGKWEAGNKLLAFILGCALWQYFGQNCSGPYKFYGTL